MLKKILAVLFTLVALVACGEKQEGVAPVELTFDVKHSETNSMYEVHASVLITGEGNTVLPDVILEPAKQTIINSLGRSIGMFFATYPEGVGRSSSDANTIGSPGCDMAIMQEPEKKIKTCKFTAMSWKKK